MAGGTISPIANIHWCKNPAVEVKIAPFAVIFIKLPVDFFFLLVPANLSSAGLEGNLESP